MGYGISKQFLAGLFVIIILISGCTEQLGFSKPAIRSVSHRWGNVTDTGTEIITNAVVYNPNPIGIPLKDFYVTFLMNGIEMGTGRTVERPNITANSESRIMLSSTIDNNRVSQWWVSHIQNGERTDVRINGELVFDIFGIGFTWDIQRKKNITTDVVNEFNSKGPMDIAFKQYNVTVKSLSVSWGAITHNNTELIAEMDIYNGNDFSIDVTEFDYVIKMNRVLMADRAADVAYTIEPGSHRVLNESLFLDNSKLDAWWVTHINNSEVTDVYIKGDIIVHVQGQEFTTTIWEGDKQFVTDILG